MFSERLKILRNLKEITQVELAKVFEVSGRTIYMWEAGERKPDIETLVKLAQYFDVTTDYLLGLTDNPHGHEQPATIAARPTPGMEPISQERLDEIIAEAVAKIRAEAGQIKEDKQ